MLPWVFKALLSKRGPSADDDDDDDLEDVQDHDAGTAPELNNAHSDSGGTTVALRKMTISASLPILPPEAFLAIISFLQDPEDVISLLLISRQWSASAVSALYASPPLKKPNDFANFIALIVSPTSFHPYPMLVQRIDVFGPAADEMEIGDLETALGLCQNLTSFRLTSCMHISSILLQSLADFCPRLESLELRGCPVGDGFLPDLIAGCPGLRLLDLSESNVSSSSISLLIGGLLWLERLNLDALVSEDTSQTAKPKPKKTAGKTPTSRVPPSISSPDDATPRSSPYLHTLSLGGGTRVSPPLMRTLSSRVPSIVRLILSNSQDLVTDDVVAAVVRSFPALEWLEVDWCPKVTDVSLQTLAVHRSGGRGGGGQYHRMSSGVRGAKAEFANNAMAPIRRLWCCGTGVTANGVRLLARECGGLVEVRLDGCARLTGSFIETIAFEAWQEVEGVRLRRKSLGKSRPGSAAAGEREVGKSRLPVRVTAKSFGGTGSPRASVDSAVQRPPFGWCRLESWHAIQRVAEYDG
ncbi:SCF ubiquitin ligase complex subunit [Irineochytrium annulatum]|nr:SCF ubiquitin ligase complex subunit [Irineochytrium annulatum]